MINKDFIYTFLKLVVYLISLHIRSVKKGVRNGPEGPNFRFAILFTVIAEIVNSDVKAISIALFAIIANFYRMYIVNEQPFQRLGRLYLIEYVRN